MRAFHEVVPLDDADIAALWPLVVLRGATLVTSGEHQAALDPDNESATEPLESEWRIFQTARSVPFDLAEATLRAALGRRACPAARRRRSPPSRAPVRCFPDVAAPAVVDLSATSDALTAGRFLAAHGVERDVLRAAAARTAAASHALGRGAAHPQPASTPTSRRPRSRSASTSLCPPAPRLPRRGTLVVADGDGLDPRRSTARPAA